MGKDEGVYYDVPRNVVLSEKAETGDEQAEDSGKRKLFEVSGSKKDGFHILYSRDDQGRVWAVETDEKGVRIPSGFRKLVSTNVGGDFDGVINEDLRSLKSRGYGNISAISIGENGRGADAEPIGTLPPHPNLGPDSSSTGPASGLIIDNSSTPAEPTPATSPPPAESEPDKKEEELSPQQKLQQEVDRAKANVEEARQELEDFNRRSFSEESGKTQFNLPNVRTKGRESNEERKKRYVRQLEIAEGELKKAEAARDLNGPESKPPKEKEEESAEKRLWKDVMDLREKKDEAKKEATEKPEAYAANDALVVATTDLEDQLDQLKEYNEFISAKVPFTQGELEGKFPADFQTYQQLDKDLIDVYDQIKKSQQGFTTSAGEDANLIEKYEDLIARKRRLYLKLLRLKKLPQ